MKLVIIAFLLFLPLNVNSSIIIVNGSFEDTASLQIGRPYGVGYWCGDICEVVEAMDGIVPYDGNQMVKFVNSTTYGPSSSSVESQLYQFINLGDYQAYIETGEAQVTVSFYVNRIPGDSETDTEFKVGIDAFAGGPGNYPNSNYTTRMDSVLVGCFSDGDVATWERIQAELTVPAGTDYLCIIISAVENVYNDGSFIEFDGHYCDFVEINVFLPIAVEKSSWGMIKKVINSHP